MSTPREILVIDDEGVVRDSCERILADEGFRVATVERGRLGLEMLAGRSFDAVLLDLKMPGMGGLAVLAEIRKRSPDVRVVVMTGYATVDTERECLAAGAAAWLAKPFGPEDLLAKLDEALG